jgi:hypothetical protein
MTSLNNPELIDVLRKAQLSFRWDDATRTWQLEKPGDSLPWRSVMYVAKDQGEAETNALKHVLCYYVSPYRRWLGS